MRTVRSSSRLLSGGGGGIPARTEADPPVDRQTGVKKRRLVCQMRQVFSSLSESRRLHFGVLYLWASSKHIGKAPLHFGLPFTQNINF